MHNGNAGTTSTQPINEQGEGVPRIERRDAEPDAPTEEDADGVMSVRLFYYFRFCIGIKAVYSTTVRDYINYVGVLYRDKGFLQHYCTRLNPLYRGFV